MEFFLESFDWASSLTAVVKTNWPRIIEFGASPYEGLDKILTCIVETPNIGGG